MAPALEIVPALSDHVAFVASNMRQADREEVAASSGKSPFEALEFSLSRSSVSRTVLVDGVPAGMFGCGDLNILTNVGSPWLLATDDIASSRRQFLAASVDWRDQLLQRYSTLRNVVDDRNLASIRWLKWLGFSFSEAFPIRKGGPAFRLFEMRRP